MYTLILNHLFNSQKITFDFLCQLREYAFRNGYTIRQDEDNLHVYYGEF